MTIVWVALAGFLSWLINTSAGGGGEFVFIVAVTNLLGAQAVAPLVTVSNLFAVPSRVLLFREHIEWTNCAVVPRRRGAGQSGGGVAVYPR